MTDWTLDSEICSLAGKPSVREALRSLGILSAESTEFRIEEAVPWYRAGAESYICRFRVHSSSTSYADLVLKACVAFSPARSLEDLLETWIRRRRLLAQGGAVVPQLFAWGRGVVLEEFIPESFAEALTSRTDDVEPLCRSLAEYSGILAGYGFLPIDPFCDLRVKNNSVVSVDFGEDLGDPFTANDDDIHLLTRATEFINRYHSFSTERIAEWFAKGRQNAREKVVSLT